MRLKTGNQDAEHVKTVSESVTFQIFFGISGKADSYYSDLRGGKRPRQKAIQQISAVNFKV